MGAKNSNSNVVGAIIAIIVVAVAVVVVDIFIIVVLFRLGVTGANKARPASRFFSPKKAPEKKCVSLLGPRK